ncbi:tail protein X [Bradyrhizobium sp. BWC-3-1]|uniref:tail protein X n=1 Tax=Bradyrhizobium sp. BWC-3-1 TaxID=3080012 RepID=UPI00293E9961|nr:tail protein X [Bradyrhizobium sp. BWC-3-1]WOH61892.1 tail protein X [Bradyrhizobium sp. BWC-3-1]
MATYTTKAGETVDYIAWKFYGAQDNRTVEQVLAANPGLADHGPGLPPGLNIELPTLETPTVKPGLKLWD